MFSPSFTSLLSRVLPLYYQSSSNWYGTFNVWFSWTHTFLCIHLCLQEVYLILCAAVGATGLRRMLLIIYVSNVWVYNTPMTPVWSVQRLISLLRLEEQSSLRPGRQQVPIYLGQNLFSILRLRDN